MKRKFVFLAAAMAAMCVGCSSESDERQVSEPTEVTLTFSPYEMSAMTRTATSIADFVTHLDVWITEGGNTTSVHQTTSDANFGTITVPLVSTRATNPGCLVTGCLNAIFLTFKVSFAIVC